MMGFVRSAGKVAASVALRAGGSRRAGLADTEDIARRLDELRVEHRDLDEVIEYLIETGHPDQMKVRRLKKRKLKLKDDIKRLESQLIPDLDA